MQPRGGLSNCDRHNFGFKVSPLDRHSCSKIGRYLTDTIFFSGFGSSTLFSRRDCTLGPACNEQFDVQNCACNSRVLVVTELFTLRNSKCLRGGVHPPRDTTPTVRIPLECILVNIVVYEIVSA